MNESQQRSAPAGSSRILRAATVPLFGLALLYFGNGAYTLLTGTGGDDLRKRWDEQRCVAEGRDPYVVFQKQRHGVASGPAATDDLTRDIHPGGYPPWAFLTGFLFTPPIPFQYLRVYFLLVNVLCLTCIACWAYAYGNRSAPNGGLFLAAACLAVFANAVTLRLGNYAIVITALLVLLLLTERSPHGRWVKQGLLLGIAALKPNISALFGVPFIARRRWLTIVSCAAYLSLASGIVWWQTGSAPWTMLGHMYSQSAEWDDGDSGVIGVLMHIGAPRNAVVSGALLTGAAIALIGSWCLRNLPLATSFAILAVVARLWMYHRRYDDTMLIFLLVVLGGMTLQRPNVWRVVVFSLVGLSLWMPFREQDQSSALIAGRVLTWLLGVSVVLYDAWNDRPQSAECL